MGFISDSTLKLLVEDNVTQWYLIQQKLKNNISIQHGKRAAEVVDNSLEKMQQWSDNDVDKLTVSFDTADIISMLCNKMSCDVVHEIMVALK